MGDHEAGAGRNEENALNELEQEIFEKLSQLDENSVKRVLSKLSTEVSYFGCPQWLCNTKIHAHM